MCAIYELPECRLMTPEEVLDFRGSDLLGVRTRHLGRLFPEAESLLIAAESGEYPIEKESMTLAKNGDALYVETNALAETAETPVKVWKIMEKSKFDGSLRSPHIPQWAEPDGSMTASWGNFLNSPNDEKRCRIFFPSPESLKGKRTFRPRAEIGKGWLHCYSNPTDAEKALRELYAALSHWTFALYEAEIPAGTRLMRCSGENGYAETCAEKLKIVNILKTT